MIEKGKVLFDETNLPIIIQRKKEIWQLVKRRRYRLELFLIIFLTIPLIIFTYYLYMYDLLIGIIISFICLVQVISFHIFDILAISDKKKDLIVYENGITLPYKPMSYVIKHKNWFVPFNKIKSIRKENDHLCVAFKEDFSEDRSFSVNYIYDWSKFNASLEGKV